MQHIAAEDTLSHLDRLSAKPGVQSTLIISRSSGAVVQSSGLVPRDEAGREDESTLAGKPADKGLQNVEEIARLVFNFVSTTEAMMTKLNGADDDDLRLLRLRTKKHELVIVPGMYNVITHVVNVADQL